MADNTVKVILSAVDNASKVLNKVNKSAGGMRTNFNNLIKEVPGLRSAMALITNPITLVGAGLGAVAKFAGDATRETISYTKTVRDLAQNLNVSTEETSRLIQTADDYGITIGSIETAMKMALKNGFAPSIDTLADMADKYNEIQDPTQRAAELTKVFGRNWAELTPMLKEGGQAIRDAAASQSKNLLVTEESAKAARDYEIAMDAWGDTMQGLKYFAANEFIPTLTKAIGEVNKLTTATVKITDRNDMYRDALDKNIISEREWAQWIEKRNPLHKTASEITDELTKRLEEYNTTANATNDIELIRAGIYQSDLIPATEDLTEATEELVKTSKEVEEGMDRMKTILAGDVGKAYDDFTEKNIELTNKGEELRAKISELEGKSWLTKDQKQELEDLRGELDENNTAIQKNAEEWDKATAKIVFDMAVMRANADGMVSEIEFGLLTTLGGALGLFDQKTENTLKNVDYAFRLLEQGAGINAVDRILRGIIGNLQAIPGSYTADIYINTHGNIPDIRVSNATVTSNKVLPQDYAGGVDFIVPPGYPNDSYPMRVESGEHVTVTPPGKAAPAQDNRELIDAIYSTRINEARLAKLIRDAVLQAM